MMPNDQGLSKVRLNDAITATYPKYWSSATYAIRELNCQHTVRILLTFNQYRHGCYVTDTRGDWWYHKFIILLHLIQSKVLQVTHEEQSNLLLWLSIPVTRLAQSNLTSPVRIKHTCTRLPKALYSWLSFVYRAPSPPYQSQLVDRAVT